MERAADEIRTETDVAGQHAVIGNQTKINASFRRNDHRDARWFPDAGLGLFLHMGISSVSGEADISWSMMKNDHADRQTRQATWGDFCVQKTFTPADYWALAKDYKLDRFDPEKILLAARRAGCKYAVMTTKHHDGFAHWPSSVGDFNIGNFQPGRDVVAEFVAACRATGLKVGLYFSPPDWYFNRDYMSFHYGNQQPPLDIHHQPCALRQPTPEHEQAFLEYTRIQVEELLSNYGKIDLLWFDGDAKGAISFERIRQLQPGIAVNPRAHGYGDFATHECRFPDQKPEGWWEYCHILSDGAWAYLQHEAYKPAGWLLTELSKARSWGGSFLPDVGPDSHGELPEAYYRRMEQIERWMTTGGESVFGTSPGPWPEQSNQPVTVRENRWYLHVGWLHDTPVILRGIPKPERVFALASGSDIPYRYHDHSLTIDLPQAQRSTLVDVIVVDFPASVR